MNSWVEKELRDIGNKFYTGGTPSTKVSSYWSGHIPWITSKWLNDSLFIINGEKKISEDSVNNSATKIVPSGNIIFATRVGVGKVCVNKIDIAINQDLLAIELDKNSYSPEFFAYQLRSAECQNMIQSFKRGATIQGITKDNLKSIKLQNPPLPEQRKIAAVLSTVQKAIETQAKLIERTTELKKTMMHKLFTEGTRGEKQKMTEIGLVPESWEVVEIGEIIKKWYGGGTPSTKVLEYWKGDNPWITSKWLSDKIILKTGEKFISNDAVKNSATSIVPKHSLIFATRVGVGKIGINLIPISINQDLAGGVVDSNKIDIYYIAYQYLIDRVQNEIESYKRGATIKGITRENLKSILFCFPRTITEQNEISKILKDIDKKIEHHTVKKQKLEELFRTLLYELMTAGIRVNDIDLDFLEEVG